MNNRLNILFVAGALLACFIMYLIGIKLQLAGCDNTILNLEFADRNAGNSILASWKQHQLNNSNLLSLAKRSFYADFFFIFFYAGLIWRLSYRRMQHEPAVWLNELLRLNVFLGIVAGLLDVSENVVLLYNISFYTINAYVSTAIIAWAKFILVGWVVVVWLFSLIKSVFVRPAL